MKKILLLIVFVIVASLRSDLEAQKFSQGYSDSTKQFLYGFIVAHPQVKTSVVVDNDTSWINSAIGEFKFKFFECHVAKVRKTEYDPVRKRELTIDSITITGKEAKLILAALKASKGFKWTKDFFPYEKLSTTRQSAALYENDKQKFRKNGVWAFSLPAVIRNGRFLVCYDMYYCGSGCGQDELALYENVHGYWKKFGDLFKRKY